MRDRHFFSIGFLGLALWVLSATAWAQQPASNTGAASHMLITVEAKHGNEVPDIHREDVMVYEGHDRDTVTDWIPAQGDHAALELFVLIDDSSNTSLGTQLEDIRKFITAQPETAKIGVAYMQDGVARVVQDPTTDHARAAQALRLPMGIGGVNASPYFSLTDLIKRWPVSTARHEVIMVTDGIDPYYGIGDLADPYVDAAIDDAAKAGVVVYGIYNPGVGHLAHSYWQNYWGQLYLSELAVKTGGEAYYIGFTGAPVTFAPYLQSIAGHLEHQYLLGFTPKPQKKAGWQHVRVSTEVPNVDLVSPERVYVQAKQ